MTETVGTSEHVHANGLRHHVLSYGQGAAPLLILPGITSPAITAEFIACRLAERYRVHVPDLRGRGSTDTPPAGHYTLEHYADDVAGLVEALELRDPVLLGHSLGARIAAAYRIRHGAGRSPLVLVDPPLSGPGRDPYPTSRAAFLAQLDEAARGTTADEVGKYYPKWPRRELELRARVLSTCDRTAVVETHEGFEREDFFAYWQRLNGSVALIRGAESPVVSESGARELAESNPEVPISTVAAAGHMVPWDNFDGFCAAVDHALAVVDER
ncbi:MULTISPECIES: alpha/beta hydrolase [unclassified Actinopolyspora]|uniref:alpha/beta fold hydrolase n=1 Tax=unclassified Actinopolyspora TaxID=2639451 RepID=UPI0013F60CDE|nr:MULTISPECIES: alpha/beta hydrolase [unclassified Actinopolyspora]NHD15943.1 alpha/beta hydrolase [Actinopolyspora sp. BKK2]NHE74843.1 alpha/beta hydrolase [Actinopolyspora sp. BKK1]